MLSVVIPLRVERRTAYLMARLRSALRLLRRDHDVEVVVVDSGCAPRYRAVVAGLCRDHGAVLVTDPAPEHPFAPGQARNLGAEAASGSHVLFYDADLCCDDELMPRLHRWLRAPHPRSEFLMIPCLYLTPAGTAAIAPGGRPPERAVDLAPFRRSLLLGENHLVRHLAVSTSTIVVRRDYFLALGGNNPVYRGHGCEDFDLLHRLASFHPHAARPDDYYRDVKQPFPGRYVGFRAYLAPYALSHLFDGLLTAHLWHPRPLHLGYHRRRQRNDALLQEMMRRHDAGAPPLADLPAPWQGAAEAPAEPIADHITRLQAACGYDVEQYPGLFRWRDGVTAPKGTAVDKLRKLVFRPGRFFADSRVAPVRRLARLFARSSS